MSEPHEQQAWVHARQEWVLAALDRFEERLLRYTQRMLGDLDAARDVVQFAFLRLCDEEPGEIGERLAQWLFTVCRNRALDVLRASGKEKSNGTSHLVRPDASVSRTEAQPSREPDPADFAEQADLHFLLRVLINHLPANQREAIDLWAEGFSYAEISNILECQEGNVRVLVHRGLKTIREHPQVQATMDDDAQPVREFRAVGNVLPGVP